MCGPSSLEGRFAREKHGKLTWNPQGWTLRCEKGGIRRILMNVFGNSLKFTSVSARENVRASRVGC